MKLALLILCCCLLLAAGCSTVATVTGGVNGNFSCDDRYTVPRVYSGVANDIRFMRAGGEDSFDVILDLPFSLAADTAILPYTVVTQSKYGDLCVKQTASTSYKSPGPAVPGTDGSTLQSKP